MNFLKKLGEKLGFIDNEENKTEQIMEERSNIKQTLAKNLRNINFTEDEINEVLAIITKMEKDVQIEKDRLIGSNINNLDTEAIMNEVFGEIRRLQLKSGEDIKAKIAEIRERKQSNSQ